MLYYPLPGTLVTVWYGVHYAAVMPHHGATGIIEARSRGAPRNHLVRLTTGECVVVPCGNLRKPNETFVKKTKTGCLRGRNSAAACNTRTPRGCKNTGFKVRIEVVLWT